MSTTYAILGAGMQGTSAAFDLARYAEATSIIFGDMDLAHAEQAAARVNGLIGKTMCSARKVNALEPADLTGFLEPADVLRSLLDASARGPGRDREQYPHGGPWRQHDRNAANPAA
jgi:lysine 6-dehydrogenase